jgi:hypothetical protein
LRGWAGDSLGAAHDLLYQALECLSEKASPELVKRAVGFLRDALDQYPSFGDAYYFRALCRKRLGQDPAGDLRRRVSTTPKRNAIPAILSNLPLKLYDSLPKVGLKWALVVGVSRFNPDNGAESLRFAEADATAFADLLHDPTIGRFPRANVILLTNEKATTAAIKAGLNKIARNAKPEDLVVAYIATHGIAPRAGSSSVSYLMTYDTDGQPRPDFRQRAGYGRPVGGDQHTMRCPADSCDSGYVPQRFRVGGPGDVHQDLDRLREGGGLLHHQLLRRRSEILRRRRSWLFHGQFASACARGKAAFV